MTESALPRSARRDELLELAYHYATHNGLTELSLRPLAAAIGSSPRVLLFLFGSKDQLLQALLARARQDQLTLLERMRTESAPADLAAAVRCLWRWLATPAHRPLLALWFEAYSQSVHQPRGPWNGFARQTVEDWLAELTRAQPPARRRSIIGTAERTLALAVMRGVLLDLLATGDHERTTAAMEYHLKATVATN